jgi:hypothetical protein
MDTTKSAPYAKRTGKIRSCSVPEKAHHIDQVGLAGCVRADEDSEASQRHGHLLKGPEVTRLDFVEFCHGANNATQVM